MKRTLSTLLVLCMVCVAQAQVGIMRSSGVYASQPQDIGPLTRDGNWYYYHGKSMTEKEMVAFIQKDCARAYNYYKKNHKLEKIGWAMFGTGLGISAIGGAMCIGASLMPWKDSNWSTMSSISDSGWAMIGAGAAVVGGVGIPIICVGAVRKKNAHKVYNQYCGVEETAEHHELKLTSGANGLGLALSF